MGLNIISDHQESLANNKTDNSKNGLFINGQWVTYDQYMRYYSDYLIDSAWDSTYYAYNSYYSNSYLSGYGNWTANYYVHSLEDITEDELLIAEQISHSMQCRILHDIDGTIYEDLPWTNMLKLNNNEFYYNFDIPYNFTPGEYQVIYKSIYDIKYYNAKTKEIYTDEQLIELKLNKANKHTIAYATEKFHINKYSTIYEDIVKVFGIVNYQRSTIPAEDVQVSIFETDTSNGEEYKIYQALTNREGQWEAYLYPNMGL